MNRICPICDSDDKKHLYTQNFYNNVISLMQKYDVVVCNSCEFVFADKIPSQEDFNCYYTEMSKYEFSFNEGVVSKDYLDHFRKIADFIIPEIKKKDAKIIDIGCSTGALLSVLKERGYENLLGVDPSESCVKTVKCLYSIKSKISNISDLSTNEKFDVIILSAVLEHLVDFDGALNKINLILKDDGVLFLEIPDAERFEKFIFTPFQQFSIEHINYFTENSIKNLLLKFAMQIVKIEKSENRINQTIDPDLFILSKKSNNSASKIKKDINGLVKIEEYINKCKHADRETKKIIKEKFFTKDKVIVWGIGTFTQRLIGADLDLSKILYFVDSNIRYKGKKIQNIEIKSPNDIKEHVPIFISTYSYQDEVINQIQNILKLKNEIIKIYD